MFNGLNDYKVRKVNYEVKTSGNIYTVKEVVSMLPDDTVINLHSVDFDTKLSRITKYSIKDKLELFASSIVKDTNLERDLGISNGIKLVIEI